MSRATFDQTVIKKFGELAGRTLAEWTAADIRSKARRMITHVDAAGKVYGGKRNLARMQAGKHSKPGKPPYSQRGRINRIEYAVAGDEFVVGPKQFVSRKGFTWGVLEHGGDSIGTFIDKLSRNKRKFVRRGEIEERKNKTKRKSPRPRRDPRRHETIPGARPTGVRGKYNYFTTPERREKAVGSKGFLDYVSKLKGYEQRFTKTVAIAARPFMAPALAAETEAKRVDARQKRLVKYLKRLAKSGRKGN